MFVIYVIGINNVKKAHLIYRWCTLFYFNVLHSNAKKKQNMYARPLLFNRELTLG